MLFTYPWSNLTHSAELSRNTLKETGELLPVGQTNFLRNQTLNVIFQKKKWIEVKCTIISSI